MKALSLNRRGEARRDSHAREALRQIVRNADIILHRAGFGEDMGHERDVDVSMLAQAA